MAALGLLVVLVGATAAYSGIRGVDVVDRIRSTFTGKPPAPPRGRLLDSAAAQQQPQLLSAPVPGASAGAFTPPSGAADGSVARACSAPLGPIPCKPTGKPTPGAPGSLDMVPIGQGSHQLNRTAAAAFKLAESYAGQPILVTDSYRSYETELAASQRPGVAPGRFVPGYSLHQVGLAVDIVNPNDPTIVAALERAGWVRWSPSKDPVHFSYGIRG